MSQVILKCATNESLDSGLYYPSISRVLAEYLEYTQEHDILRKYSVKKKPKVTSLVYALTWAFGAAVEQSPESENHRPLVFLHHLANTFGFADRNKLVLTLTLKQTQRLKGSVARTIPQEIRVRTSPQRPTPDSLSSAEVGHS